MQWNFKESSGIYGNIHLFYSNIKVLLCKLPLAFLFSVCGFFFSQISTTSSYFVRKLFSSLPKLIICLGLGNIIFLFYVHVCVYGRMNNPIFCGYKTQITHLVAYLMMLNLSYLVYLLSSDLVAAF